MSHSKSCRCKICCSIYPDYNIHDCSYHWKNRFCKLRKKWSEHSKCGSIKHHPEDCTYCRSPCDKAVGRFGVAWVAELPDCDNGEPKGWQVEISDTTPGIIKKFKELVEWLNNPPAHLFDSIKGNEICYNLRYPKCCIDTCDEYLEEPCCMESVHSKCEDIRTKKKCRINCSEDKGAQYCLPCNNSQTDLNDNRKHKCVNCINTCQNKCCGEQCEMACPKNNDECSDQENSKPCQSKCRWSSPAQKDDVEIFRKESCCCQCHDKYFKNAGTTYEIDTVPQKDIPENNTIISDLTELDSRIICAGIGSSQICKKLKEEKRNQLIEKPEKELNTVIAKQSSEDDITKSLYISAEAEDHSVINNNLMTNSMNNHQRRSSKFRKKET